MTPDTVLLAISNALFLQFTRTRSTKPLCCATKRDFVCVLLVTGVIILLQASPLLFFLTINQAGLHLQLMSACLVL